VVRPVVSQGRLNRDGCDAGAVASSPVVQTVTTTFPRVWPVPT
jgi:hypothetical protein